MASERVLVVGLGEVGRPLYELICETGKFETYGYDVNPERTVHKLEEIPRPVDYLHICIPCFSIEDFVKCVLQYVAEFRPRLVVIHSTVPPGTTRTIHERAPSGTHVVHSPVRGVHRKMKEHLRFWTKWVGPVCSECRELGVRHLEALGFKVKLADNPETTELAKLWETTIRAVLIATWHEVHRTARKFQANILQIAEFIGEVHEVLRDRPLYFPGVIGGHCLIPNTELLLSVYDSPLLRFVLESNKRREAEIQDESVRKEVEMLQEFCKRFWNLQYLF